jgi:acyl carrier protein
MGAHEPRSRPGTDGPRFTAMNDDRAELMATIRKMIVRGLHLDLRPEDISETGPIFGEDGLGLDSLDALELVVLVEEEFGVSIPDEEIGKRAFASVAVLADFIVAERGKT